MQKARIMQAFDLMVKKYPDLTGRDRQRLLIQATSSYPGIRPRPSDWLRMLRWGFWPGGLAQLLRASLG
jgi:hypothetical protein